MGRDKEKKWHKEIERTHKVIRFPLDTVLQFSNGLVYRYKRLGDREFGWVLDEELSYCRAR